jgi:hypothetical protein
MKRKIYKKYRDIRKQNPAYIYFFMFCHLLDKYHFTNAFKDIYLAFQVKIKITYSGKNIDVGE